jgi:hypothetical protein
VLGLHDLLGAADGADEQKGLQLPIVVVACRAVVQVVARRGLDRHEAIHTSPAAGRVSPLRSGRGTAPPAPLLDGHLGRDGAFHRHDRLAYEMLGDRGVHLHVTRRGGWADRTAGLELHGGWAVAPYLSARGEHPKDQLQAVGQALLAVESPHRRHPPVVRGVRRVSAGASPACPRPSPRARGACGVRDVGPCACRPPCPSCPRPRGPGCGNRARAQRECWCMSTR